MLTYMRVRTYNRYTGVVQQLLTITPTSLYRIKNISGLGPVSTEVNQIASATEAGGVILGTHDVTRNIVIDLTIAPDYVGGTDATDLRRELMPYFTPGNEVRLEFNTKKWGVMYISGTVESHEPNIFTKDPAVQISILCANPYFTGPVSLHEELFTEIDTAVYNIDYSGIDGVVGLAPVGFIFQTTLLSNRDEAWSSSLTRELPDRGTYIVRGYDQVANDIVKISSVRGNRYATRTRSSSTTSIMAYFTGDLSAFKLYPGENRFRINGWPISTAKVFYTPQYIGI